MTRRVAITVRGIVQGVGFRPFVYNLATTAGVSGWIVNQSDAVRLEVEGPDEAVDWFLLQLREQHPPQASIDQLDVQSIACQAAPAGVPAVFEIRASVTGTAHCPTIPPDLATCSDCAAEIADPAERRYGYAFTNCTNCGPRWSIITGLPYDRSRTAMDAFAMCAACARQYENPADRRFHAQPIACPDCGPALQLLAINGELVATDRQALREAGIAVRAGAVLALKGLGGFQLIVDATSQGAVERLRARKQRPGKPFAVMFAESTAVTRYCQVSPFELSQLTSPQAPILLLRRQEKTKQQWPIAASVAPGIPDLGVMLPNTPLHRLLIDEVKRPIVCTSGNLAEEPMAIETAEALQRLSRIADFVLTHNRTIVRPVDDSVAREDDGQLQLLRRARGFAPVPIALHQTAPCILAVGGHLKNTISLSIGSQVVVGPHVGDLDNTLSMDVHRRAIADLLEFFAVTPRIVACDLHPDYSSTQHAEQLAAQWDVPLVRVQHHLAHTLSAIAEHRLPGPVLGLAWDGTGYGVDGTIWGGEAIVVDGPRWTRVAHLRPFSLPGGDRAAREPRRSILGQLYEIWGRESMGLASRWFEDAELTTLFSALQRPGFFPRTSSMGRLFDGVAALGGLPDRVSYEGEAAMRLEFAADPRETTRYDIPLDDGTPAVADWQPLLESVVADRAAGVSLARISARFHNSLAVLAGEIARRAGCSRIVLTGGCFQNRLLTQRTRACLSKAGWDVYTQRAVPPGDGGISLGQVLGAMLWSGSSSARG